ncbi:MAG: hypothetical protein AAFX87_20655 [Bacteroidota bacterium]
MRNLDSEQALHAKYAINTFYGQEVPPSRDTVEVFAKGNSSRVLTSKNKIFQSEELTLMIIEGRKMAYAYDALDTQKFGNQMANIGLLQDSLINRAEIVRCETVCIDDQADHNEDQVQIILDKTASRSLGFSSITYRIDTKEQELRTMKIDFGEDASPSALEFTILEFDQGHDEDVLQNIDLNNMLLAFERGNQGYRLVDLRKNQ